MVTQKSLKSFVTNQCFYCSPIDADAAWTKVNVDQLGYYRVNYPLEDWNTFQQLLLGENGESYEGKLSNSDRTSLINDAFRYWFTTMSASSFTVRTTQLSFYSLPSVVLLQPACSPSP